MNSNNILQLNIDENPQSKDEEMDEIPKTNITIRTGQECIPMRDDQENEIINIRESNSKEDSRDLDKDTKEVSEPIASSDAMDIDTSSIEPTAIVTNNTSEPRKRTRAMKHPEEENASLHKQRKVETKIEQILVTAQVHQEGDCSQKVNLLNPQQHKTVPMTNTVLKEMNCALGNAQNQTDDEKNKTTIPGSFDNHVSELFGQNKEQSSQSQEERSLSCASNKNKAEEKHDENRQIAKPISHRRESIDNSIENLNNVNEVETFGQENLNNGHHEILNHNRSSENNAYSRTITGFVEGRTVVDFLPASYLYRTEFNRISARRLRHIQTLNPNRHINFRSELTRVLAMRRANTEIFLREAREHRAMLDEFRTYYNNIDQNSDTEDSDSDSGGSSIDENSIGRRDRKLLFSTGRDHIQGVNIRHSFNLDRFGGNISDAAVFEQNHIRQNARSIYFEESSHFYAPNIHQNSTRPPPLQHISTLQQSNFSFRQMNSTANRLNIMTSHISEPSSTSINDETMTVEIQENETNASQEIQSLRHSRSSEENNLEQQESINMLEELRNYSSDDSSGSDEENFNVCRLNNISAELSRVLRHFSDGVEQDPNQPGPSSGRRVLGAINNLRDEDLVLMRSASRRFTRFGPLSPGESALHPLFMAIKFDYICRRIMNHNTFLRNRLLHINGLLTRQRPNSRVTPPRHLSRVGFAGNAENLRNQQKQCSGSNANVRSIVKEVSTKEVSNNITESSKTLGQEQNPKSKHGNNCATTLMQITNQTQVDVATPGTSSLDLDETNDIRSQANVSNGLEPIDGANGTEDSLIYSTASEEKPNSEQTKKEDIEKKQYDPMTSATAGDTAINEISQQLDEATINVDDAASSSSLEQAPIDDISNLIEDNNMLEKTENLVDY